MLWIGKNESEKGIKAKNVLLNIVLNFAPSQANLPFTNGHTGAAAHRKEALPWSCALTFATFHSLNPTNKHPNSLPVVISMLRLWRLWATRMETYKTQAPVLHEVCLEYRNKVPIFAPQ